MNPQMQQMMQTLINSNMPMFQRAYQMTQGKSEDEIKQIAMNICKEKGINFDQAYQEFTSKFGKGQF